MKAWVANWKRTGEELDRLKWEELRGMDEQTARRQSAQALAMAEKWPMAGTTLIDRPCGMLEQQFWFSKWPRKSI